MHQSNNSAAAGRGEPPRCDARPRNHSFNRPAPPIRLSQGRRPQFHPDYRDRPPGPPPGRPNFIVQLRRDSPKEVKQSDAESVIRRLRFQPQKSNFIPPPNQLSAALFYEQWSEALGTMVQLWGMKLNDEEFLFSPRLVANVEAPSDRIELNSRLKVLFLEKLKELKEGELVQRWRKKLEALMEEHRRVSGLVHNHNSSMRVFNELWEKREGLDGERNVISNRIEEFRSALRCIEEYLKEEGMNKEMDVEVFQFVGGNIEWERIYKLMMRECRRLDDGLPIYAHRRGIMRQIHCEQVPDFLDLHSLIF